VISVRKEETGVLVVEFSEHLWPEDFELVVPAVHDAARSAQNPLLLLVEVGTDFDTPPLAVLHQILQPGILAQNRSFPGCSVDNVHRRVQSHNSFTK
jgi:hypothetical protein